MEVGLVLSAAQVAVAIADWLISPLAERVINRAFSYLGSSSADNLRDLENKTKIIKDLLLKADLRHPGDILGPWMTKLKTAYSEAEDILDVIDYHRIESHILSQKHDKSASTACPRNKGKDIYNCTSGLKFWRWQRKEKQDINLPRESKRKLQDAIDQIRNLIREGHDLLSQLSLVSSSANITNAPSSTLTTTTPITTMSTTSAPPTSVFGRDRERVKIIDDFDSLAARECYTIVGIHGVAGSGKSTLAQHVLKKQREDEHFDVIMWIHVTQTFSVVNVLKEMLEIVSDMENYQTEQINLDKLQTDLTQKLNGQRFFLVLDDVWYEGFDTEHKLKQILHPLKLGKTGSRILLTSRNTDVAAVIGAKSNLIVDLEEEAYIAMFMHYALDGATLSEEESKKYHSIGKKIAQKLGRSPLAAAVVASQLKTRPCTNDWIDVMKSDLLEDTMGALFWSYQQLDENIKQCFRYCSIFPRRYELEQDWLVRQWIALGFVKTTSDTEDIEKVAKDYFHVLLSSSFIQPKQNTCGYLNERFTIHDLLHDLAENVSRTDCFTLKEGKVEIPPDVQHVFIESYDPEVFMEHIFNLKALRTLIVSHTGPRISKKQFENLLSKLQKLRVLHVKLKTLEKLPACIGEQKHLRSLRFWGHKREITLPLEFTKLYHLQELSSPYCIVSEDSTREKMTNLVNLRHMDTGLLNIPNIGGLGCLRTLFAFEVKKEKGYEIHQLGRLDNLCDSLKIAGLENVKSKEEALQAKLDNKVYLFDLELQWIPIGKREGLSGEMTSCGEQAEVFEALRPPPLIKSLSILCYSGSKYPSWLLEAHGALELLEELKIQECDTPPKTLFGCLNLHNLEISLCEWYCLPESMEQLKSLRTLHIRWNRILQSLPELPESLELHRICGCPKLWESYVEGGSSWEKIQKTTKIEFEEDE